MEFILIKRESIEWEYLWNKLSEHPINEGLEEPSIALNEGEAWEYTGSYKQGDEVVHSLRHRLHPKTNYVVNVSYKGSEGFTADQIQVSKKV
jgi:hypothetical protein